jgi:hypothetical protein
VSPAKRKTFLLAAILASVALSLPILGGFFALDDLWLVQSAGERGVGEYFTKPYFIDSGYFRAAGGANAYFRPLVRLTYLVDFKLWGLNPDGYFATGMAIHALVMLVFFMLAMELGAGDRVALLAAAIFGTHPAFVAPRVSIVTRQESLALLFLLLCIFYLARSVRTGRWAHGAASACAFILSLGFKETAVIGPFLGFALLASRGKEDFKRGRGWLTALFGILAAYAVFRLSIRTAGAGISLELIKNAVSNVLPVFFANAASYAAIYPFSTPSYGSASVTVWTVVRALAFGAFIFAYLRAVKTRSDRFWLWWLAIASLPGMFMYGYHLFYIPGPGFACMAAGLIYSLYRQSAGAKRVAVAIAVAFLALNVALSLNLIHKWKAMTLNTRDKLEQMAAQISRLKPSPPAGSVFYVERPWDDPDGLFRNSCHGVALDIFLRKLYPGRDVRGVFYNSILELNVDFSHPSYFFNYHRGRVREIKR